MRLPFLRTARNQGKRHPVLIAVPKMTAASLAAVYHGDRVGGDCYDFLRVAPHLVLFGLLDVAGRFDENRGIVSAAQDTFRRLGIKLFSRDDINEANAMIELSLRLNRAIMEAAGGVRSCPAFVGCFNESLGTICYSNAGHTPALLRDSTGVILLPATGLPFGLFSHVTHDAPTAALEPGAAMLLVSRGVTEGKKNGEEFGLERVKSVLLHSNLENAERVCSEVLDASEKFTRKAHCENDVTALVLLRAAAAKAVSLAP
jgi:serine phosphatase RsbU (regulator of sigma subunit)